MKEQDSKGRAYERGLSRRAVVAAGAVAPLLMAAKGAKAPGETIVEIESGKLRGLQADGIHHFLGIPYGAPTGPTRFLPPKKAEPWAGIRDATDYGPISPQSFPGAPDTRSGALAAIGKPPKAGEHEDCLNINVWTPGPDRSKKRAVMVWIHGGAYAVGSGSMSVYNGANLARRGDIVVVNITHRLNVLGYTYLGAMLGDEYRSSGLVGILDLILALQWVRDNIANFGGDPANVTIFGESGGGGKVSTLLAMPKARGLFQRAIIESGPQIFQTAPEEADRIAHDMLQSMGLPASQADRLRTMPINDLMRGALGFMFKSPLSMMAFQPVIDGTNLPESPFYPTAPDTSRDVPVLAGTNLTESAYMWMGDPTVFGLTDATLEARLGNLLGKADIARVLALYRRHYPWATPTDLWMLINSERSMRRNLWRLADARVAARQAPTYVYHFRFPTPYMAGQLRTPHFLEVPLLFQNHHLAGVSEFTGRGPEVDRMADTLSDLWISFAKTGRPSAGAVPDWPAYDLQQRGTMVLDAKSRLENDPDSEIRRFWQSADFQII